MSGAFRAPLITLRRHTDDGTRLVLLAGTEKERAGEIWQALEQSLPSPGFTCGWTWTDAWLRHYGDVVPHDFVFAMRKDRPIGAALLTRGGDGRRSRLRLRTLHVGTAGEPHGTSVYVEYNRLLAAEEDRATFARALLTAARRLRGWHELRLDGFAPEDMRSFSHGQGFIVRAEPSPYRDLRRLRDPGAVIESLGRSTRWRIRRTLRILGPVTCEWAERAAEARSVFDELIALHQADWTRRGLPGLFASSRLTAFHRDVAPRLLGEGRAVLARVRAGGRTVGCIYGHLEHDQLLVYQTGFARFPDDNRVKPGLVTHALCMQEAAHRGLDGYDLLAGTSRYKQELTDRERELFWARALRVSPRPLALEGVRRARGAVRSWAARGDPDGGDA